MNGRKNILVTLGLVLSASLIASAISVLLVSCHYSRSQFDLLSVICSEIAGQKPETTEIISAVLKDYTTGNTEHLMDDAILSRFGYHTDDFSGSDAFLNILFITVGTLTGISLFVFTFLYRNKLESGRIQALAEYLEQINTGKAVVLTPSGEDDFAKLEDEIYKTVTFLYHTKDTAVQAKNAFAENLSNIAHQIKTPITALSLSVQMMKQHPADDLPCAKASYTAADPVGNTTGKPFSQAVYLEQVERQLSRLKHLEEALLVLSRIDAGTLLLEETRIDVFTLLVLASDNLQELSAVSGISIEIPNLGEMMVIADLDWTMEAVMNLMKNCMEHSKNGVIHCSYSQNPLYTEIQIWDEGDGFAKEDIPHLFERFYRGQNAGGGGIGLGLALSKEIIERQNGTIRAMNRRDGGGLFEIRFYRH
ncbi:MAG: HAMP domain-containing histidine kinase [Dorea sp.]|nr:HAMP domain-containing histidine kinase [Dorea sp.]